MTIQDYNRAKVDYLASGIGPSLNWYKVMTSDIDLQDSKGLNSLSSCFYYSKHPFLLL